MLQLFYKKGGAVSIFLVIVLLPVLSISAVLVDMSRIKLARSVAESVGDLTLNTALTCYDNVLKDMYGLFAVSQDYDSLMDNLEDYYRQSISASNLPQEEIESIVDNVMDLLASESENEAKDLLNINTLKVSDIVDTKVDGTSLVSPAMLKSQIVNFMKFRAPINGGLGFLDSLKSFTTISDQNKVVDAKKDYYEEQQEVIETCEETWIKFFEYNENEELTEQRFEEMSIKYNESKDGFRFINDNIVRDIYEKNQDSFSVDKLPYANKSGSTYNFYNVSVNLIDNVPSESDMKDYIKDLYNRVKQLEENESKYNTQYLFDEKDAEIYMIRRTTQFIKDHKNGDNDYASAIVDLHCAYQNLTLAIDYINDEIKRLEDEMAEAAKLAEEAKKAKEEAESEAESSPSPSQSADSQEEEEEYEVPDYSERIAELNALLSLKVTINSSTGLAKTASEALSENRTFYEKKMDKFVTVTDLMMKTINGTSYIERKDTVSNVDLVNGGISDHDIKTKYALEGFYKKVCEGIDCLEDISSNLSDIMDSVRGDLKTKLSDWDKAASADSIAGSSIATSNIEEIKTVEEFIDAAKVEELKTHVDNAIASLNDAKNKMEQYKYGKQCIHNIHSLEECIKSLKDYSETKALLQDIPMKLSSLNQRADDMYEKAYQAPNSPIVYTWEDKNHIKFEREGIKSEDFYSYLKATFQTVTDDGYQDNKKEQKKKQEETEEKLKEAKENTKNDTSSDKTTVEFDSEAENLPSKEWKDIKDRISAFNKEMVAEYNVSGGEDKDLAIEGEEDVGSSLGSLFGGLGDLLSNAGATLRDNYYMSSYIMDMFSYDTFENEVIWEANEENGRISEVRNLLEYQKFDVDGRSVSSTIYDADGNIRTNSKMSAEAMGKITHDVKTMTLNQISPMNNKAYLSEVEYILFGDGGTSTAYGTIYAIRMGFNTIYAFCDSSIREGARNIATLAFGTPPLTFLIPVATIAIIIGVALAESAIDLQCLKAGMAVPIYKTKETWTLSFDKLLSTVVDAALDEAKNLATDVVGNTIDSTASTLSEWLNKTDEELKELANDTTGELEAMTKSVTAAMKSSINQYVNTAIDQMANLCQKAQTLELSGDLERLNLTKEEYVVKKLDEWLEEANGTKGDSEDNNIMLIVKAETVEKLKNEYVAKMLSTLENITDTGKGYIEEFNTLVNDINRDVTDYIVATNEKVNEYITKANQKAQEALKNGAAALKDSINQSIDGLSLSSKGGKEKVGEDTNIKASLFSFQYSDYMQLFLLIGLCANEDNILVRTSDVIQSNMQLKREDFLMKQAYTCLQLDVDLEVKPILMRFPFMSDQTDSAIKKSSWYTIHYHGVQGYN